MNRVIYFVKGTLFSFRAAETLPFGTEELTTFGATLNL